MNFGYGVMRLNDAGVSHTFTEHGPAVSLVDADAALTSFGENDVASLTIAAANIADGEAEVVTIAGNSFALGTSSTVTGVPAGGSTVDIAYDAGTGVFSITNAAGAGSVIPSADWNLLVSGMTYENSSHDPAVGAGTNRTFTYTFTDTDGLASRAVVSTIIVLPVNDAPQIDLDADDSLDEAGTFPGIAITSEDGTTVTGTFGDGATWGADYTIVRTAQNGFGPMNALVDGDVIGLTHVGDLTVSNDTYTIEFQATARPNTVVDAIVFGPRTGPFMADSTFTLTWTGGGSAVISDPDDQIDNYATGDVIAPGAILIITTPGGDIPQGDVSWSVTVDADNLTVDYVSTKSPDSESNTEALLFNVLGRHTGSTATFTEGGAAVNIADSDADLDDIAEGDVTSLAIVAVGIADGASEQATIAGHTFDLSVDGAATGLTAGASLVDITYVAATGTFTIVNATGATDPIPQADLDALIRGITYENTSENPTAGNRTFAFTATDAGGLTSNTATATVDVVPVNDAPVGVNDTIPVTEDVTAGPVNVLGNDTDAEDDPLTIASASIDTDGDGNPDALVLGTPTSITDIGGNPIGTITVASSGDVTFDPAPGYTGSIPSLTYVPNDGTEDGSLATVTFGPIMPVNDAPVAVDDSLVVAEDSGATVLDLTGNDTDPDSDPLTVMSINGTALTPGVAQSIAVPNGTVNVATDGTITFTPDANYNGPISFDYTVSDRPNSGCGRHQPDAATAAARQRADDVRRPCDG